MASPKFPSKYVLPLPFGEDERLQKRAAERYAREQAKPAVPTRLCRSCGTPLTSGAEYRLGIHVWCVYNITQHRKVHTIPRPRYGQ